MQLMTKYGKTFYKTANIYVIQIQQICIFIISEISMLIRV